MDTYFKLVDTDFKLACPLENHWKWKLGGSAKVIPILYTIWAHFITMHLGRQTLSDRFIFKLTCRLDKHWNWKLGRFAKVKAILQHFTSFYHTQVLKRIYSLRMFLDEGKTMKEKSWLCTAFLPFVWIWKFLLPPIGGIHNNIFWHCESHW